MSYKKILLIFLSVIIAIILFSLGVGIFIAFIQDKFGNNILWVIMAIIFILCCIYLIKTEIKEKKELKIKKVQHLDIGKCIFKNYENEFEVFYTEYLDKKEDNQRPIDILYEFADKKELSLLIDWRGEDEGEIEEFIISKTHMEISWLNVKKLRKKIADERDGNFIIKLLKAIDKDLKVINKKLLFFDLGNDSYSFMIIDISTYKIVDKIENSDFHGTEKL